MTFFTLQNCDCSFFLFLLLEIFIGVFKVASAITTSDCCTYKVRALVDVMHFLLGTKECGLQVICRFTSREDWRRDCQICDIFITLDKGGDHCSEGGIISMISSMKILIELVIKSIFL